MKKTTKLLLIAGALVAACAQAQAPTWSEEQAAVWTVVDQSWEAQAAENGKWPGDFTHEKFVQWGGQSASAPWQGNVHRLGTWRR